MFVFEEFGGLSLRNLVFVFEEFGGLSLRNFVVCL